MRAAPLAAGYVFRYFFAQRLRGERPPRSRVPQGRLNLAQNAVLGWRAQLKSPEGTTEEVHRGKFRSSLHDVSTLEFLPRNVSWATFSSPCGTHFAVGSDSALNALITGLLEEIFRSQLQLAVVDLGAGYLPKGSVAEIGVRSSVLGSVESIESFESHLQALRFRKRHLEISGH